MNHNEAESIRYLAQIAAQEDGVAPLSEQFLLGLEDPRLSHNHLVCRAGTDQSGDIAGLVAYDADTAEVFVAVPYRNKGLGTVLVQEALTEVPAIWAHGDTPAAQRIASKVGLSPQRELLVMGRHWTIQELPQKLPASLSLESLSTSREHRGAETVEAQWLAVNNEAFSWHPEQGNWSREDLQRHCDVAWFDPDGVIMLWDGDTLAGFHWTKRHSAGIGEVYVIGLADAYQGRGLSTPLLQAGLNVLGEGRVILYVESDNASALRLYQRLGFEVEERHVLYSRTQ